jgi:hypothetical protein
MDKNRNIKKEEIQSIEYRHYEKLKGIALYHKIEAETVRSNHNN